MRTSWWVTAAVAIVLMAAVPATAQVRGMGRINGVVVDEAGEPMEGVTIRTATGGGDQIESHTDAKGKWTLTGIGRGEWHVLVVKPGYGAKKLKVIVEREIDRSQDIKITLAKGA